MDLATLAIFRAVAHEHSITRAAEVLGRVPSNVTTRIQGLEAELGVPLFQRDKKRMILTPEGRTYLDYAERILNLAEEAQQVMNPTEPSGTLRVGSMESTAASRLPGPLARFNAQWPDVTLDLSTGPTLPLIDALLTHRLDCALIALPADGGLIAPEILETVTVFREDLVVLLPPGHPMITTPEEIKPHALAAFAPGCTYRMLAEDWLTGRKSRPRSVKIHEIRSYHAMMACTAAGACFSVLPRSVVDLMPGVERFTIKSLLSIDTVLAWRPGFSTPAFTAFRATLSDSATVTKG